MNPGAPLVRLDRVTKRFGSVVAVNDISLDVDAGEFFALLGPSGCGKTTMMRLIAGFEAPDAGRIFIGGIEVTDVPAYERPVNMMFQSYALFPHMSVERNIAFGLVQEGLRRREIGERIAEMLRLVQLEGLGARKPEQLSGGQKQRVAGVRALARRPQLLLLDEPLAALDRRLREATQFELMEVQRRLGTAFILVTHDQEEASIMASRMAVMRAGRLEQIGTPAEIYAKPASRFIAEFIGDINILHNNPDISDDLFDVTDERHSRKGRSTTIAVRPERILIASDRSGAKGSTGEIQDCVFRGRETLYRVRLKSGDLLRVVASNAGAGPAFAPGDYVRLHIPPEARIPLSD
ncbi:MAG: ABC transporter ATP-binding protein [Beijerinckiaceae bacterium]